MVLKDAIKGTCERSVESSKAVNDGNGNNIADTYQKKIGIGNFTGNIDLISENVTCICESLNIEGGELPLNNEEGYFFVLKTDCSEEGNINSENIQTAFLTESGKYRKFIRIGGAYTGYGPWKEAPVNENIEFKSEDDKNPSGYTDVDLITDGEKQSSLWRKVSLFAKNVRYLWKLCGTSDISGLADGTLTGAVSKLNTDIIVRLSDKVTLHCVGKYVELDMYDYVISNKVYIPEKYYPSGMPVAEIAIIAPGVGLFTGRVIVSGGYLHFYDNNWENVSDSAGYYVRGSVSYIRASGI